MKPFLPVLCAVTLFPLLSHAQSVQPLPTLPKSPRIDGDLRDLTPARTIALPNAARTASAQLELKLATQDDKLIVGVTVRDSELTADDLLDLTFYFPNAGLTAQGVVYRFGQTGLMPGPAEVGAAPFARALVTSAQKRSAEGFTLEATFPARALPRQPATSPLRLSVCLDYADVDAPGQEPTRLTSCPRGEMEGGPIHLAEAFRRNLKLTPPASVEGIEPRAHGWVGHSKRHQIVWAWGDEPFTPTSLEALVAPEGAIDPASVALPAVNLRLRDGRVIVSVLTGKNPFSTSRCVATQELKMALYVIEGARAIQVLDAPAATCALGRAMRVELSGEDGLEIGYTSGATHTFTWEGDHFERSELG